MDLFLPPARVCILRNAVVAATVDEAEILRVSALIEKTLIEMGYATSIVELNFNTEKAIAAIRDFNPDFVFNLAEAVANDMRFCAMGAALLEHLQLPFTGAGLRAHQMSVDKTIAKLILAAEGIPQADWITTEPGTHHSFAAGELYIIKAAVEHGSVGLDGNSVIRPGGITELLEAVQSRAERFGTPFFAERYIMGRDFTVPILARKVIPIREFIYENRQPGEVTVQDYKCKWIVESPEYENTSVNYEFGESDALLLSQLAKIAERCVALFSLRGYARIDFRVDADNRPFVLDVNVNPSLGDDTSFYFALEEAKISYSQALAAIIGDIGSFA